MDDNDLSSEIHKYNMETLLDCIDDIVLIVNEDKVVENVNNAFYKLTNIDGKKFIGENIWALKEKGIMEQSIILSVFESKKVLSMDVTYNNGSIVTYTAIPVLDEKREITKVIATGRDITYLCRLKEKLQKVNKEKQIYMKKLQKYMKQNNVVYSSEKMTKVFSIANRASKTNSPIFITGESGVGKEEIAKFIYTNSNRKDKPFITINCAAIPPQLLESEFFGYEEGAFTGAKKGGRKGLLEEANKGTVFLDEIGELNIEMQSKLLRVLQENKMLRVGGNKYISLDIRYICATNLSFDSLLNNSKFRQDLYYRLCVIPINVPPLRERREDIVPLISYFLSMYNKKYDRNIKLSKFVIKKLYTYEWLGNIRELKNIIERLVVLSEEDEVKEEEFNIATRLEQSTNNKKNIKEPISINEMINLNDAYKRVDQILINKALKQSKTINKAATLLGINPSTIYRKIKKGDITINKA
ncbi:sigma-54 interaction domain-containing protein [Clostridium oceanicum]|uniref:Sigma 54-interacting transcriptional regulator n=1 Tax=Clostridium oceanicum TaxID=1543 RepID=A0ABN1J8F8_9CLOT